mmetsp:Transcript_113980/g.329237  ORF Transcript_113980/g.329237 Transcript_113980/m.329237 type:complete len:468 (+) Transcript_113980:82-1485(+)
MSFLGSISEGAPLPELDMSVQTSECDLSSLCSPTSLQTKKRQRRLTLTAMTGALGDIRQDALSNGAPPVDDATWGCAQRPARGFSEGGVVFVTPRMRTRSDASSGGASTVPPPTPEGSGAASGFRGSMPSPAGGDASGLQSPAGGNFKHLLSPDGLGAASGFLGSMPSPARGNFSAMLSPKNDIFMHHPHGALGHADADGGAGACAHSGEGAGGYGPSRGLAARGWKPPRRGEADADLFGSPVSSVLQEGPLSAFQSPSRSVAFMETPRGSAGGICGVSAPSPARAPVGTPQLSRRSPTKQRGDARDNSPNTGPRLLPGFKRTRDSIGPDLSPEVMMQRAAQKFAKPTLKRSASDSSNSDEDEMAFKSQRRQKAFEYGLKAAEGPGESDNWATNVGVGVSLSPRSFARGCKAAEVAARVEGQMRKTAPPEAERMAEETRLAQSKPVPESPSPRRKRPNPLLRKAVGS